MVCMWCLQHSFEDTSTAHCGGCVLGCSLRKQGMAMSTPRHCVVKIQDISSCEQVFPHQAKFYIEILCLAPSEIAPRTSSVFNKGSPARRDSGRHDTMDMGSSSHATSPPTWRQRRPGLLRATQSSESQLLMKGLDPGRADLGAGKDGFIPVSTRNIASSAIPSRTTLSTASFSFTVWESALLSLIK